MMSHPEFWTSLAFVLIVVLACRPIARFLSQWTKEQDDKIQSSRDEVEALCRKAEQLKSEYEKAYLGRFDLKAEKMKEAEHEIALLKKEVEQESKEKIARMNQEMALRLKMIEENGIWNLKKHLVGQVVSYTQKKLTEVPVKENAGALLEEAFEDLDRCYQQVEESEIV